MKILITAALVVLLAACNNSATVSQPNDQDHTENKDTSVRSLSDSATDSRMNGTDTLRR